MTVPDTDIGFGWGLAIMTLFISRLLSPRRVHLSIYARQQSLDAAPTTAA